ncbi:MAG: prolipoprotein diacylglyceryl transferase, partial [Bacilli bacterium]|nr:prolipoprotein diacylglyceryl transferase [Bacilli bacterium]
GVLESTFLIAFPAGVIGARLFYVLGQWSDFASNPITMFSIWDGGLTILGGALTGIVVGVGWFMWRNKGYNIFIVADIVLPAILIAQAVGRWGNFFNCEVHGIEMSGEYWQWLPKIIYNNIQFGHDGYTSLVAEGNVFVPLFLIEGAINMLGFFLLAYLFGKKLRNYTAFGDLAFGYFIWYGLTRAILEPLRDDRYIMNDFWSWFWSLAFIIVGVLGIILNHTIRNSINQKKGLLKAEKSWYKTGLINTIIFASTGVALISISLIMIFSANSRVLEVNIANYQFMVGLIILSLGIGVLGLLAISIPYTIRGHREIKRAHV